MATTTKGGELNLKQTIGYNVRSWVTSLTGSLYSQTNSYGTYSGNISAMSWKSGDASQCNYAFTYDNLSRLRSATYTGDGQFGTSYSYDKHGNITALSRSGRNTTGSTYGPVDNLSFTYDGNQVTRITDGQKISFAESGDFRDYAAGAGANSYNANGALISDSHKGILGISYNLLNLPREVAVKTSAVSGKVYYIYAADGTKLQTRHLNGLSMVPVMFGNTVSDALLPTKKTTDYVGNMVYENGSLKRILIDGGYIEGGVYNYYLKDHLGNNRVVLNGEGAVFQQTTYYPFGMAFATNTIAEQDKQPYKFGGKGLDRQNGLNMYDFSARQYEPAIGRFTTQDPLAEKYYSISPYAYCSNNPITRIDPTGCNDDWFMTPQGNVYWTNKKTKTITVGDEKHFNIGSTVSIDNQDGSFSNYFQNKGFISSQTFNARDYILDNGLAGKYLSNGSGLSQSGKAELMTAQIHRGQSEFLKGALEISSSAMQTGGDKIATIGYLASVSGLGASAGVPLVALGNVAKFAGVGIESAINYARGNNAKASYKWVSAGAMYGIGMIGNFAPGSGGALFNLMIIPFGTALDYGGSTITTKNK